MHPITPHFSDIRILSFSFYSTRTPHSPPIFDLPRSLSILHALPLCLTRFSLSHAYTHSLSVSFPLCLSRQSISVSCSREPSAHLIQWRTSEKVAKIRAERISLATRNSEILLLSSTLSVRIMPNEYFSS